MEVNEKTKIGLFTAIGILIGAIPPFAFIIWLTAGVSFKADSALAENIKQDIKYDLKIEKIETKYDTQMTLLIDIRDRLSRMEGRK